jgi:hypothetical protein
MRAKIRVLMVLALSGCYAFSIPGLVPTNFKKGEKIPIFASKLRSEKTFVPFAFYWLNWCDNSKG